MSEDFRLCGLVPSYDNPATVGQVVRRLLAWLDTVVVVDDGSAQAGRQAIEALTSVPGVRVHRRERNGGKGAAVKDGFRIADSLGFTHALQVDADGQHRLEDTPRFIAAARRQSDALIAGTPVFDDSAPRSRLIGRKITRFWTRVETHGKMVIEDPMCGFRIYPLSAALCANTKGDAMDFDPEIAVRMVWGGTPVVNLPTRIVYPAQEHGGVSHFRLVRDNVLISSMHTRLVFGALIRLLGFS